MPQRGNRKEPYHRREQGRIKWFDVAFAKENERSGGVGIAAVSNRCMPARRWMRWWSIIEGRYEEVVDVEMDGYPGI